MKRLRLIGAVAGLTLLGAAVAQAAPGFSTANVNIRTGPDTDFPSIGVIPEGDDVEITGCLRDESWCDVIWAGNRGWVYSEYLAFEQRGGYVPLPDVGPAAFRIPIVTFVARDYWDRYYTGRPWYKDRSRWYTYKVRPRPGWRAPPPGKRTPGWWRQGYRAPTGLKAPPDHRNWKRPPRRDDRRDDRRGDDRRGDDRRGGDHRGHDRR
jgi:uncharacterized protein YraI